MLWKIEFIAMLQTKPHGFLGTMLVLDIELLCDKYIRDVYQRFWLPKQLFKKKNFLLYFIQNIYFVLLSLNISLL